MGSVQGAADPKRFAPERPSLPPLLMAGLAFWVGMVATEAWFLVVAFILFAVSFLFSVVAKKGFAAAIVFLFLALGCSCGLLDEERIASQRDDLLQLGSLQDCVVVAMADSSQGSFGSQCLASSYLDGRPAKLLLSFRDGDQIMCGERLLVSGGLSVPENSAFLDSKGASAKVSVRGFERIEDGGVVGAISSLRGQVIGRLGSACENVVSFARPYMRFLGIESLVDLSEVGDLFLALACGFRPGLSSDVVYSDFQAAGLAHLVAVSGAHLALVSGLVSSAMERLRIPRRTGFFVLVALLLPYVVMVGMPISCVRAAVMALLSAASFLGGRRSSSLSALGVVMVFFMASDPSCSSSLSFQLSVLSTLGISLFAPWVSWWVSAVGRVPRIVKDSLSVTIAATIPTLPLTVATFAQMPLVSPVSNLLAGPVLGLVMPLCLISYVCFLLGPLLLVPVALGFLLLALLVLSVKVLLLLPLACMPMVVDEGFAKTVGVILCSLWWLLWPPPIRRNALKALFLVFVSCVMFLWPYVDPLKAGQDRLVMLDVGQGDSFLLQSRGKSLLVDTGRNDKMLLSGLASEGISHLDAVALTHCDDDHYGSLDALEGVVGVDEVIVARGTTSLDSAKAQSVSQTTRRLTGRPPLEVTTSDVLIFGSFRIEVVSPERVNDGGNQDSLVLNVSVDEGATSWSAIMAGDAETECLEPLADQGKLGDVDILKVSHHGSKVSVSDELLDVFRPELSLVSVGEGNRYGHPSVEALDALERHGSRVLRSDQDGKVTCVFGPGAISVTTLG